MLNDYKKFLTKLKKKNYKFKFFHHKLSDKSNILLRHDVDFDVDFAVKMAQFEKRNNVKSTFFFLLTSAVYNILNKEIINKIISIKKLGHEIGLHFDPSAYNKKEVTNGLKIELKIFEKLFKKKVKIISFHKPNKKILKIDKKILGINHTYQKLFSKKMGYFADSRNTFRYGHPLKSIEFNNNLNLQILIHPIWWQKKFDTHINIKVKELIKKKNQDLKKALLKDLSKSNLLINND